MSVTLYVSGGLAWSGPLESFLAENADAFGAEESAQIARAVWCDGEYRGGGGASPSFTLIREDA